ncbi:hypothetical protein C4D60_Mb01t27510 [Musa balbisiana]|uniref:Lactate/malate dehydrogenase C-terminal domain-containing protein n=1 Tax=Musa balbisiana TaxID=52838 RepID=A0A4S8JR55_MUSBA|nr:hypothetical protein C4D60_Mb01t27510 [Musa balbisiana]
MEKSDGDWRRESTIGEERTKRNGSGWGKHSDVVASRNVKVLVVGNPCNTNTETFLGCELVALKAGVFYDKVSNIDHLTLPLSYLFCSSNHYICISLYQVTDFLNAKINGMPVTEVIRLKEEFTERVQKLGGVLIQKWGRSSAVSTVDAIRSLVTPTPDGDWFFSGVYTTGNHPYGIAEDIVFSMPCRSKGDGDFELVKDAIIDDYLSDRIKKTQAELLAEKRCVAHLTGEVRLYLQS